MVLPRWVWDYIRTIMEGGSYAELRGWFRDPVAPRHSVRPTVSEVSSQCPTKPPPGICWYTIVFSVLVVLLPPLPIAVHIVIIMTRTSRIIIPSIPVTGFILINPSITIMSN